MFLAIMKIRINLSEIRNPKAQMRIVFMLMDQNWYHLSYDVVW